MRQAHEKLFTPNELARQGIMSLVRQWQERKAKRLGYYQVGRKIYYGEQSHIAPYFAACERGKETQTDAS